MELKQKKNQEDQFSQQDIDKFDKVINTSTLPLFKLISDVNNRNTENHEPFYIFFIEKSDYLKQLEKNASDQKEIEQLQLTGGSQQVKNLSNYEMKTRSIYKQPIRIQLLVNAIIKGNTGDKNVNKQYAFSQLFNAMKNNHIMQFVGEGFFDLYYISVYRCTVTDKILDHLLSKIVYVSKDSDTVLLFKNESLNLKQEHFHDFFLPQEENFKYYSVSDYLKKATYKLYKRSLWFLHNHDNSQNPQQYNNKSNYQEVFGDLTDNIYPDVQEKIDYDKKCQDNPSYKMEICHYYQTNSCIHKMNSIKCKFAHGEIELRGEYEEGGEENQDNEQQKQQQNYQQQQEHNNSQKQYSSSDDDNNNSFNNKQNSHKSLQSQDSSSGNQKSQTTSDEVIKKQPYQKKNNNNNLNNVIDNVNNKQYSNNGWDKNEQGDDYDDDNEGQQQQLQDDSYNSDCFFNSDSSDNEDEKQENSKENNNKDSHGNNQDNGNSQGGYNLSMFVKA